MRRTIAVVVLALMSGLLAMPSASAASGAASLTITSETVLAAGGEVVSLAGTAVDGVGAVVSIELVVPFPQYALLGTTTVQDDGTWSVEFAMPVGPDGLLVLQASAPSLSLDGRVAAEVRAVRSAGGTQAVVQSPASSTVDGASLAMPVEVVVHQPGFQPPGDVMAMLLQQGVDRGRALTDAQWSGIETPAPTVRTTLDLSRAANGPALLAVGVLNADGFVAVAVKHVTIALEGGLADVVAQTTQDTTGFPRLSIATTVRALGPGASVTYRVDGGDPMAASQSTSDPSRFGWGSPVFDPPPPGSDSLVGPRLLAEGAHSVHVEVTNRGTTKSFDVPFVIDTAPRLTVDDVEVGKPISNPTTGFQYWVNVRGHAAGVLMSGGAVDLIAPESALLLAHTGPFAGGGPVPESSTWGFGVRVAGWERSGNEPLRLRVSLRDIDGAPRCVEVAVRSGFAPALVTCGATVPGRAVAAPMTWRGDGLPFTLTWAADGGHPVSEVRTHVRRLDGIPGPTSYVSADTLGTPATAVAPIPAPGTAYELGFSVESILGAGPATTWGTIQSSGVSAESRRTTEGSTVTAEASVKSIVPGLSFPAALPVGSGSIRCRSVATGRLVVDATRTPLESSRRFFARFSPRSNLDCAASFAGDPRRGIAPSSRPFRVWVAPRIVARADSLSIRTLRTTTFRAQVSSVGRGDRVTLQRRYRKAWRDVRSVLPSADGRVAFTIRAMITGTTYYRVVQASSDAHLAGRSNVVALRGR